MDDKMLLSYKFHSLKSEKQFYLIKGEEILTSAQSTSEFGSVPIWKGKSTH